MHEVFEKIKERVCEFIHVRNKSGSAPCKNQRASCLQLIRVCDLTAIINQVAEEYVGKTDTFGNSEQVNKGWIPCSERLPDVSEEIEDSECPEFNVTIKGAVQSTTLKYAPDGTWFDDDGEIYKVIAWQPLPESYKPREE